MSSCKQPSPVPDNVRNFLLACRFSESQIDACSMETRLLHDLGVDGDTMLDFLELLQDEFGVDMSQCRTERYTPSELSKDALILTNARLPILGRLFWKKLEEVKAKYEPVTLGMIAEAIERKEWPT